MGSLKSRTLSFYSSQIKARKVSAAHPIQSLPNFFTTGKLSSFLSQEIIKQKQLIESKQNKGTDSSPVSEVAEVGSYTFPTKTRQACTASRSSTAALLLEGWVHAAHWEQPHITRARAWVIQGISPANKASVLYKSKNQLFPQQHGWRLFKSMGSHSLSNLPPLTTPVWWSISISVVLSHQNGLN